MAKWKKFQGTGTAIVTPFKKDGSLDEKSLRRLVDFQIKGGVEAIIAVGTTGESPTVSNEEHHRIFEIIIEQTNGRAKVFAGTGSNSTKEAIEHTQVAKTMGADAALVVGPYYNKPTQEGYFQHYRAIAEAVNIPIIVYNVPGRTGGNIEASTTLRMAEEIPNVVAVKEASGNMAQVMEIARNKPEKLSLLSGDDALTLPMMALGGDGCISVVANETPKDFFDKHTYPLKRLSLEHQVRVVPGGSSIRDGAFVAKNVVIMPPAYINVGAYVDEGTMVDSHALVGSCAQIGKRVHLSAATQIGGVLEPVGAMPVIIENDVMVGGNCGIYEGTIVKRRSVIGSGVVLTGSTPVYDLVHGQIYRRTKEQPLVIPEGAVVIQGSRHIDGAFAKQHHIAIYTPVIIKYRDEKTDAATALEESLR